MSRNDTPYYVTINQDGDTLEVFDTQDRHQVRPTEDYHQILFIDPRQDFPLIARYSSLYDLFNTPS